MTQSDPLLPAGATRPAGDLPSTGSTAPASTVPPGAAPAQPAPISGSNPLDKVLPNAIGVTDLARRGGQQ